MFPDGKGSLCAHDDAVRRNRCGRRLRLRDVSYTSCDVQKDDRKLDEGGWRRRRDLRLRHCKMKASSRAKFNKD